MLISDFIWIESVCFDCPNVWQHFASLWANLTVKVKKFNDIDGSLLPI